jgi:hypothetical protein
MGAALVAHARVARMSASWLRAPRAAGACAAPPPQQQLRTQLRTRQLASGVHRGVLLPLPRGKAPARQPTRAASLPDDVLQDVQLPPHRQKRAYLPHEMLRAAVQLSDAARGGKNTLHMRVSSDHAAPLLLGCKALLPCHSRAANYGVDVVFEATHHSGNGASQGDDSSAAPTPLMHDVAAAQKRLLRLLDALEAAAPEVLSGSKDKKPSLHHLTERVGALAAFAAHVPDEAWAQPPETWTPRKKDRCARVLLHATCARRADAACESSMATSVPPTRAA